MAPTPQNEAKEPDKTENKDNNNEIRTSNDIFDDLNNSGKDLDSQDSNVSTLDDGQLKALLDEAINYKTPKDREGKSRIFKVLLHQAETEERNARAASASGPQLARYYNTSARKRNKTTLTPSSLAASTTQGGSLQDLIATKKPLRRKKNSANYVSSRNREGGSLGSLPTNSRVDTSDIAGDEQTLRVDHSLEEGQKPRGRFQSESEKDDEKNYFNSEEITHRIPRIRYTSRATLEVEACSGAQPTISVDKPVSFSQLETGSTFGAPFTGAQALQLETEYSSVKCIVDGENLTSQSRNTSGAQQTSGGAAGALMPTQYRLLSVANPKLLHNVDKYTDKKAVDENCNSLNSCDSKKKKKCSKVDRNVTINTSENLPGHRADIIESIDLLVKFIEDDTTSGKNKKSLNHKLENKKRRGQKKSTSVKKSNSLEEISQSKFDDFVLEDSKSKKINKKSISEYGEDRKLEIDDLQEDFRVVTKKKKYKKRLIPQKDNFNQQKFEFQSQIKDQKSRRKSISSIIPSEKSDSSDLDSVHSLPATGALSNLSSLSTALSANNQSYAEIAKNSNGNQTQFIANFAKEPAQNFVVPSVSPQTSSVPPVTPNWKTPQMSILNPSHFPTLPAPDETQISGEETKNIKIDIAPSVPTFQPVVPTFQPAQSVDTPTMATIPNLGCNKRKNNRNTSRPAVIILDESVSAIQGITFGFEVNQQLLGNDNEPMNEDRSCHDNFLTVGDVFKRYSVPENKHLYNHDRIVNYIGLAWEDILQDSAVQYYRSDMV